MYNELHITDPAPVGMNIKGWWRYRFRYLKGMLPASPQRPGCENRSSFVFHILKRYHFLLILFFIVRGVKMRNTAGGNEGTVTLSHAKAHNSRELHIDGTHRKLRGLWP